MFLWLGNAMAHTLLTCLKKMIEEDLEKIEKDLKKEVIYNESKLNDNDGFSKTN